MVITQGVRSDLSCEAFPVDLNTSSFTLLQFDVECHAVRSPKPTPYLLLICPALPCAQTCTAS